MLKKLQKRNSKGFTIIEVMIVLAIAALILLIVLLAVPALQRNSRNTSIKNDASTIASGINEFVSNNDGQPPTNIAGTGTVTISSTAGGTTSTQSKVQSTTVVNSTATVPAASGPAIGTVTVFLGHKCENAAGTYTAGTAGQATTRAEAVYYSVEVGGGTGLQQKCITT